MTISITSEGHSISISNKDFGSADPRMFVNVPSEVEEMEFEEQIALVTAAIPKVLKRLGIKAKPGYEVEPRFSRYAGCTDCPCSPGFVLWQADFTHDLHVTFKLAKS